MVLDKVKLQIVEGDLLRDSHREALAKLVNAYMLDEMGERRPLGVDLAGKIVSGLSNHPVAFIFFADYAGELVGMSVCFLGFSTFYGRGVLNIHDLIVLPQYRKNGIARKLLEAMEEKARSLDCCKVTLEVREDNLRAMSLYRSRGFSAGKYPMYFWTKMI